METIRITCGVCGHRERDSIQNQLMAKIRMWNHVNHKHPPLADEFRQVVRVYQEELDRNEQKHGPRTLSH